MRRIFSNKQIFYIGLLFLLLSSAYICKERYTKSSSKSKKSSKYNHQNLPIIIWWTSIIPDYFTHKKCGIYDCMFTTRRDLMNTDGKKAFLFYGSELNYTDLPLPRSFNDHIWGLLHEESPKNIPYIQYEKILRYFNITSTFSQYSDMPLTTQFLKDLNILTSQKYLIPIGEKNKLRIKQKLAPVAFIQSICDTMSGRDEYVSELMKYIEIDSYGKCLNNKKLPKNLSTDYLQTIDSDELYKFLARYKFIISYENGICNDYITEKFWRPLIIGSVPVYFGAPNIEKWMPNKNSAILIKNFQSPKELAYNLHYLDSNDIEYNKYLDHKYSQIDSITNKLLIRTVLNRDYSKDDDTNIFENFECLICKYLYQNNYNNDNNNSNNKPKIADQKHYDCTEDSQNGIKYPKMENNMKNNIENNDWYSIIKFSKCEANILNEFLIENKNFTAKEFHDRIAKYIENNGECNL